MRRLLPAALFIASCLTPVAAWAQQRAVVLRSAGPSPYQEAAAGFREGYRNAQEVIVAGNREQLANRVREIDPDIVFAIGPAAHDVSTRFLSDVPVVNAFISTPEDRSGSAIYIEPEVAADVQLRRIHNTLPGRKRIGVMFDPEESLERIEELERAAAPLGLSIVRIPVERAGQIGPAFREATSKIDALLFIPDATVSTKGNVKELLRRCIVERVPVIGYTQWFADNGAVLSVSIDYRGLGRQAADQAKRAPDAGGRVVSPQAVIATYNMRAARKLNVIVDVDFDDPSVRTIE